MKSRRLPWLLSALAATAALAAMGESPAPAAAAIPAALQERMPVIRVLLPRIALPAPTGDPFAPATGPSTVTEPVPETIGAIAPAPRGFAVTPTSAPPPWRVIGKQQEDGAGWSVFLARGEETWVVREGDTLDEDYRVASIKPPTLILQHLKRKTRSTIDIGDSLE